MNQTIVDEIKYWIGKSLKKIDKIYQTNISHANFVIEKTKNIKFGDFFCNIAMIVSIQDKSKIKIAQLIKQNIKMKIFEKIEVVKPGFINFFINKKTIKKFLNKIKKEKESYGQFKSKKLSYNLEFVSANPTGLLHIGHARNGVYGEALTKIWKKYGIKVTKEYYVNDNNNQIKKLNLSILINYLSLFKKKIKLPKDGYCGNEIKEVAKKLKENYNDKFLKTKFNNEEIVNKIDDKIIGKFAIEYFLNIIKQDLKSLDIDMEIWTLESDIYKYKLIDKVFKNLNDNLYKKANALWLKTTKFGDDKDRVVIKSNNEYTYFATDIAYHDLKLSRGYDKIFNIWGADHKSYVDRISIAMQLLGYKKEQLHVCIMQMVQILKNEKKFKASKRLGNTFTIQDIVSSIGKDATKWYLVNQSLDSHIQIDLKKISSKSIENSLFYVQYAYVRIKKILAKTKIKLAKNYSLLNFNCEKELINQLLFFKPTIENIAKNYGVHKMTNYLFCLAKIFHVYYENSIINDEKNKKLTSQKLSLINDVAIVIKNGLNLLGIKVMEQM